MRHSKILLTTVGGKKALFVQSNSSRRSRRSVEHGNPSDHVKEWARQLLRVTQHNGHIAITDGSTFVVDHNRCRLRMIKEGDSIDLHNTVFRSIGWTIVEGRPHILN